ncbi:MAG TPA: hypothetical protein VGH77_20165 [Streptosporangiaceae bacterium]
MQAVVVAETRWFFLLRCLVACLRSYRPGLRREREPGLRDGLGPG